MTKEQKSGVRCIRRAMGRLGKLKCPSPQKFFELAQEAKTAPRNFNLHDEVINFVRLETGDPLARDVSRFIVAYAEEVISQKIERIQRLLKKDLRDLPPEVLTATCVSGRTFSAARI